MEAAPVKGKPEWRSFNVGLEEVQDDKGTWGICVGCFFVGLLDGDVGRINSDDLEEGCDFAGLGLHTLRRANITWRQEVGGSSIEASQIAGHANSKHVERRGFRRWNRSGPRALPCQGRTPHRVWENRAFPAGAGPHPTSGFLQARWIPVRAQNVLKQRDLQLTKTLYAQSSPRYSGWFILDLARPQGPGPRGTSPTGSPQMAPDGAPENSIKIGGSSQPKLP
jgi:hypothetical protein